MKRTIEEIREEGLSFSKEMDGELSLHLAGLKKAINSFPGLQASPSTGDAHWMVAFDVDGEEGILSLTCLADLFMQNPDLNVKLFSPHENQIYVLKGQDPELLTLWVEKARENRSRMPDRVLH